MFPDADLLYACDAKWWHAHKGVPEFAGPRLNQHNDRKRARGDDPDLAAARLYGLTSIKSDGAKVPHLSGDVLAQGYNSGYQALNLAVLMGARRVVLLGFDMQHHNGRSHFFGDHPSTLDRISPYAMFIKAFNAAAPVYAKAGIVILNASPITALTCFPRVDLKDALT